jgi:hypothetical protein
MAGIKLCIDQPDQFLQRLLTKDLVLHLFYDQSLELVLRPRPGTAGVLALLEAAVTRVILILMGLGASAYHGVSTVTEEEAAEQVVTRQCAGVDLRRSSGRHLILYRHKGIWIDDSRPGILHPDRRNTAVYCRMSGPASPDKGAAEY